MTKEEARKHPIKVDYPLFDCWKCGKKDCNDRNHYVLEENGMCWTCNFWIRRVVEYNEPNSKLLVIGGSCYGDGGWSDRNNNYLGFGGRIFNYRRLPDGKSIKTNNLWGSGIIPAIWLDLLPDNAEWTDHKREWVEIPGGQIALANVRELIIVEVENGLELQLETREGDEKRSFIE